MIPNEIGQKLHDRATRGDSLTTDEREQLQHWYAEHDRDEMERLSAVPSPNGLADLQSRVQQVAAQAVVQAKRIESLTIELPDRLAERLRQEAERHGQPTEAIALSLLDQHLPPLDKRRMAALSLLQQWMEEDTPAAGAEEDDEFFRNLDASRTSNRVLFPPELKGVTW